MVHGLTSLTTNMTDFMLVCEADNPGAIILFIDLEGHVAAHAADEFLQPASDMSSSLQFSSPASTRWLRLVHIGDCAVLCSGDDCSHRVRLRWSQCCCDSSGDRLGGEMPAFFGKDDCAEAACSSRGRGTAAKVAHRCEALEARWRAWWWYVQSLLAVY